MDTTSPAPAPTPEDAAVAVQVQQFWNQGNQAAALDVLRPQAEANRPWAAALLAWLLMQQGSVGMDESVNWAIRAAQLGAPGQVVNTLNNLIAQISVSPQFSERVPELLEWATNWPGGFDVMGQGWNLISGPGIDGSQSDDDPRAIAPPDHRTAIEDTCCASARTAERARSNGILGSPAPG